MSDKIVVLTVRSQKAAGEKIFRLHKKRAVLGSSTSSDVRLDDSQVSPVHAILEVSGVDGKPVIYDLASDTGLKVNDAATIQASLNPNDKVQIGPYLISISVQQLSDIQKSPNSVKEAFGQKLFVNEKEDLAPLLLENEADVIDIFDHRPESKQSLQVVMFFNETILDVEHFVEKKRVVIGPGSSEDFAIPPFWGEGKSGRFDLVNFDGAQYTLNLHDKMEGLIHQDGQLASIKNFPKKNILLKDHDFAKVKINDVSFFLNFSPAPPRLKRRRFFERDIMFLKLWTGSIVSTLAILLGLSQIKVNPTIEIEQLPERVATIIYEPKVLPVEKPPIQKNLDQEKEKPVEKKPEPPKVIKITPTTKPKTEAPKDAMIGEKPKENAKKAKADVPKTQAPNKPKPTVAKKAGGQEGAGARAKGPEGSRGAQNKPKADVPQTKAMRPGEGQKTDAAATNKGKSQTDDMGVVDVFKSSKGTLSKIMAGGKGISNAASKLEGYSGFTSKGNGGLGESGSGTGGGGQSMGLGGLADKGPGGGKKGTGLGALGSGGNILGGKGKLAIDSGGGSPEPIVMGAIDTDAIARAIAAHRDEIKYSYEKEINADHPDLAARVGIRFVIGASGIVSAAGVSSTSLKHAATEGCVVEVIKRIQFPPVRGGGIAEVTYPFLFKPSNK